MSVVNFISVCLLFSTFGQRIDDNGFGLSVWAGFRAQNCQPPPNLNRSTKLHVCTSPRLTQNPCSSETLRFTSVAYRLKTTYKTMIVSSLKQKNHGKFQSGIGRCITDASKSDGG